MTTTASGRWGIYSREPAEDTGHLSDLNKSWLLLSIQNEPLSSSKWTTLEISNNLSSRYKITSAAAGNGGKAPSGIFLNVWNHKVCYHRPPREQKLNASKNYYPASKRTSLFCTKTPNIVNLSHPSVPTLQRSSKRNSAREHELPFIFKLRPSRQPS